MIKRFHVHFLGLDYAGKTTMVNRWLKRAYIPAIRPSLGLKLTEMEINAHRMLIYDLPGQERFQDFLWAPVLRTYKTDALLFYISVSEDEQKRWNEAFEALKEVLTVLEETTLPQKLSVAVVANKIDTLPEDQRAKVITQLFLEFKRTGIWDQLAKLCSSYRVFQTSALTGEGIEDILDWLTINITGQLPPEQPLIKEVHLIEENGIPMAHWVKSSTDALEVNEYVFSGFISAFQSFSSEIKQGLIEIVETATSKLAFIRKRVNKKYSYLVILSEKKAQSEDLFAFGNTLHSELSKRNLESVTEVPTLFDKIVEHAYSETFTML